MIFEDYLDALAYLCDKLGFEISSFQPPKEHSYWHEMHKITCCKQQVKVLLCETNTIDLVAGLYSKTSFNLHFDIDHIQDVLKLFLHTRDFMLENCSNMRIRNPFCGHCELLKCKSIDEFKVNVDMYVPGDWSSQITNAIMQAMNDKKMQ